MIVSPFTVVVDTREQHPFHFASIPVDRKQLKKKLDDGVSPGVVVVKMTRQGLATGDYSIEGMEDRFAIERKSKADLFHCMGSDRDRFEEQFRRLNSLERAAIVVEADWPSVFMGCPECELRPKVVHRTAISWQVKYPNVHWWMCQTRAFAELTTYRILEKWWQAEGKNDH